MPSAEFETVTSDDDNIVVRHITTSFVFAYKVIPNPSGERLLHPIGMQEGDKPGENWQHIASQAHTYAQFEMELAGKVEPKLMKGGRIKR